MFVEAALSRRQSAPCREVRPRGGGRGNGAREGAKGGGEGGAHRWQRLHRAAAEGPQRGEDVVRVARLQCVQLAHGRVRLLVGLDFTARLDAVEAEPLLIPEVVERVVDRVPARRLLDGRPVGAPAPRRPLLVKPPLSRRRPVGGVTNWAVALEELRRRGARGARRER